MSFVYRQTERAGEKGATCNLWTVGHTDETGCWWPESDHGSAEAAAARCRELNGGALEAPPSIPTLPGFRFESAADAWLTINAIRAQVLALLADADRVQKGLPGMAETLRANAERGRKIADAIEESLL